MDVYERKDRASSDISVNVRKILRNNLRAVSRILLNIILRLNCLVESVCVLLNYSVFASDGNRLQI